MKISAFWHDINKTFTGPDGNFLSLSPQVGDKSFPLEAVKQLKKIMELDENLGSHSDAHTFKTVCANPLVPQVFRPVCQKDEEVAVFSSLSKESPKGDQIILVTTHYGITVCSCHIVISPQLTAKGIACIRNYASSSLGTLWATSVNDLKQDPKPKTNSVLCVIMQQQSCVIYCNHFLRTKAITVF